MSKVTEIITIDEFSEEERKKLNKLIEQIRQAATQKNLELSYKDLTLKELFFLLEEIKLLVKDCKFNKTSK